MKTKRVLLVVEPTKKAMNRAFSMIVNPTKKYAGMTIVTFPDYETLGRVITGARLELLNMIRVKKPKSINELARFLRRNFKNVYDDVRLLCKFGLVELKEAGPRRSAALQVNFSELVVAA